MSALHPYFEKLSATSKRTEKELILESIKETTDEPLFLRTAFLCLDPRHNFYVSEFKYDRSKCQGEKTLEEAIDALEQKLLVEKIRGNVAVELVETLCHSLNEDDSQIFKNIIDGILRCGISSTTINKIWPNHIYQHPYQRASSYNEKNLSKISLPAYSQLKEDGLYMDVIVSGEQHNVEYRSRQGGYLPFNDPTLDNPLLADSAGYVLMGEALVWNEDFTAIMERAAGNGYINSDDVDPKRIAFRLWDCVDYSDWKKGKSGERYEDRFDRLEEIVQCMDSKNFEVVDSRIIHTVDEMIEHFKENVRKGLEGSVVKNMSGKWKSGTSPDQVKLKIIFEVELVVTGVYAGEKGTKNEFVLGGLHCETIDGKLKVDVGGGFTDKQRKEYYENPQKVIDRIITTKANDVQTSDKNDHYTLMNPRFGEIRSDKTEADTSERVFEQKQASIDSLSIIQ